MRRVACCLLILTLGALNNRCTGDVRTAPTTVTAAGSPDSPRLSWLLKRANAVMASNPDSALRYARQALSRAEHGIYPRQRAQALECLGWLRFAQGDYPGALHLYQRALAVARTVRFARECAVLNDDIGQVLQEQGAFPEALENHLAALRYYATAHDSTHWAYALLNVAAVEHSEHRDQQAVRYYVQALHQLAQDKKPDELAASYQGLALVYADLGRYDQAKALFWRGLRFFRRTQDSTNQAIALNNLGDVYAHQQQYPPARRYYGQALLLAGRNHDQSMIAVCCAGLAQVLVQQAEYPMGEAYARRSLLIARRIGARPVAQAAYLMLADALTGQQRFEPALTSYRRGKELEDSIYGSRHAAQLDGLRSQYQRYHEQQEQTGQRQRIQQLENAQRISHLTELLLGGLGLGLLALGWLFWRQYRATGQRDEARRQAQLATDRMAQLLNEAALREAQQEIGLKNKRLTSLALSVTQKGEFLHEVKAQLEVIGRTADEAVRKQLVRLRQSIEKSGSATKEWEQFRLMFEQVHHTFFAELQRRCPDITPNERRLAALLRLNFSSKAMAGLMGVSDESVKKARHRLRQKLQLTPADNLVEFMIRLDTTTDELSGETL